MIEKNLLAAACVLGLATAGAAQEPQTTETKQKHETHAMTADGNPYVLSDDLIGTDVETADGEVMTSIEQLIVARDTGNVEYAIVDLGGFLNVGAREVAIPWSQLDLTAPETIVFKYSKDELRTAPEFNEEEFAGMENLAEWERKVRDFFGDEPDMGESVAIEGTGEEAGRLDRRLMLSDHLVGTNIENANDEGLGEVEQLIIDRKSGRVAYVVADVGGFLGVGAREVAVPWKSLSFTGEEEIVLNRAEDLESAPRFEEEAFLAMENLSEWEREIEQFFGVRAVE